MKTGNDLRKTLQRYRKYRKLCNESEKDFWNSLVGLYGLSDIEVGFLSYWDPWAESLTYGNTGMSISFIDETIMDMRSGKNPEFEEWR